jgi:hypothetical protein
MADFSSFIQIGIKAATSAREARAEIAAIFNDLNQQLDNRFSGKVQIEIRQLQELSPFGFLAELANPKKYSALVVKNPKSEQWTPREIARWKQSVDGYPCWIAVRDEEVSCEDRVALEQELGRLLSSAPVGEAVLAAIAAGDKASDTGAEVPA